MLFGFQPAQAVRLPFAALGGTAAVPPSQATGSLRDLVSPSTEDTRQEGAEEEQQLAPLEVGGAVASGDAAAAAPAGDEGGEVERVEDAVVPPTCPLTMLSYEGRARGARGDAPPLPELVRGVCSREGEQSSTPAPGSRS